MPVPAPGGPVTTSFVFSTPQEQQILHNIALTIQRIRGIPDLQDDGTPNPAVSSAIKVFEDEVQRIVDQHTRDDHRRLHEETKPPTPARPLPITRPGR